MEAPSRPTTSGRPRTSRPQSSALRNTPGTASRLISSAALQRPSTRVGTASGIGLSTPINVIDRPITQQGLSGMKSDSKGLQRQVQDRSYYIGLLRTKNSNILTEMGRIQQEIENMRQEQSTFLTYDKKVKESAQELTELQGNLSDYNILVDLMNTNADQADVLEEVNEMKKTNNAEGQNVESLFTIKQETEMRMRKIENDIEEERHLGDSLVEDMGPELKHRYIRARSENSTLLQHIEAMQQQTDTLDTKYNELMDELSISKAKMEKAELISTLSELEEKKATINRENNTRGTPQQERELLVIQVKEDNGEIATMERQIGEVAEELRRIHEELQHLEMALDENKSERGQKYRELRKREETMDQFLATFDQAKAEELERIASTEESNVLLLEKISKNLLYFGSLPSSDEYSMMRQDLNIKKDELRKSQYTESSIKSEHLNLQANLQKIDVLETKVQKEKTDIEKKLSKMEEEFEVFNNIAGLRKSMEEKRLLLTDQKDELNIRKNNIASSLKEISDGINILKKQLSENETMSQLQNLERKWAHLEQTNFTLRENIEQKRADYEVEPIKARAMNLVQEYNAILQNLYRSGENV